MGFKMANKKKKQTINIKEKKETYTLVMILFQMM